MKPIGAVAPANLIMGLAVAGMVGAFAWDRFVPLPQASTRGPARAEQRLNLQRETRNLRDQAKEHEALAARYVWAAGAETVGAEALAAVTKRAREARVNLGAFRPQRAVSEGALERVPFVASVDGTYLGVVQLVRGLESGDDRLAVTLVQINQADPAGDRVNATLGLTAFRKPEPPPARTPSARATATAGTPASAPAPAAAGGAR